ncbi:MAG: DUF368 domain-containing protein, partial [Pseudomonadota bacterium]|nr:DUF368 domain-containing protein [Pseudomonadota bacterium]
AVAIGLAPGLSAVGSGAAIFFFSGMLAICAMILPGISGSFILLLLGMYQPVLEAVKQGEIPLLLAFMAGCALGLLSFVHVLKWTLHRFHDTVMALLAGFMAGSLLKLWPWRIAGEQGLADRWLTPSEYAAVTGGSSQLMVALLAACLASLVVWLLYRASPVHNVAQDSG